MEMLHEHSEQFNVTDKSSNFFLQQLLAIMCGWTTKNQLPGLGSGALVEVVAWSWVRGISGGSCLVLGQGH